VIVDLLVFRIFRQGQVPLLYYTLAKEGRMKVLRPPGGRIISQVSALTFHFRKIHFEINEVPFRIKAGVF